MHQHDSSNDLDEKVYCKLKTKHLLNKPKMLPCGFLACFECIERETYLNGQLNCNYCFELHTISNANKLDSNDDYLNFVKNNIDYYLNKFFNSLSYQLDNFKGILQVNTRLLFLLFYK